MTQLNLSARPYHRTRSAKLARKISDLAGVRRSNLNEMDFPTERSVPKLGSVDISEEGKVQKQFLQNLKDQLTLLKVDLGRSVPDLVHWLDRNSMHHDPTANESGCS